MNTKEMIAVMQAFMEGKKIEFRERGSQTWKPDENPEWDWSGIEYRVATEPKKDGRWERAEIRVDACGDYVLSSKRNGWWRVASLQNIPGFGGIDYRNPFDEMAMVRSMVPVMFDAKSCYSLISGFDETCRPGIPVAAWFWREEE